MRYLGFRISVARDFFLLTVGFALLGVYSNGGGTLINLIRLILEPSCAAVELVILSSWFPSIFGSAKLRWVHCVTLPITYAVLVFATRILIEGPGWPILRYDQSMRWDILYSAPMSVVLIAMLLVKYMILRNTIESIRRGIKRRKKPQ